MSLKNGLIILSLFPVLGLLVSCLEDYEYDEIPYTGDAEILSFGLSSDSVPSLSSVVFSIDQNNSLIYNRDSMAYLTEIKYKAIVTYTTASGNSLLNVTDGDSTWVGSGDSIDVTKSLALRSYALGGITTKTYIFNLNIHQIDPDSVQYKILADDLDFLRSEEIQTILFKDTFYTFSKTDAKIRLDYSPDAVDWTNAWPEESPSKLPDSTVVRGIKSNGEKLFAYTTDTTDGYYYFESTDAKNWTTKTLEYPIISILGYLKLGESQSHLEDGLSLIVKKDDENVFAFLSETSETIDVGGIVPADFPISDFASINSESMKTGYLTVAGSGCNVWSTSNGLYWAKLTNDDFPPLEGANVIYYNNEFWLLNGQQTDGVDGSEVYSSENRGSTWTLRPEKCRLPEDYTKRSGASVVVDAEGVCFYILGGKDKDGSFLSEIWKGSLNKRTFNR